jgi:hypothetical protein
MNINYRIFILAAAGFLAFGILFSVRIEKNHDTTYAANLSGSMFSINAPIPSTITTFPTKLERTLVTIGTYQVEFYKEFGKSLTLVAKTLDNAKTKTDDFAFSLVPEKTPGLAPTPKIALTANLSNLFSVLIHDTRSFLASTSKAIAINVPRRPLSKSLGYVTDNFNAIRSITKPVTLVQPTVIAYTPPIATSTQDIHDAALDGSVLGTTDKPNPSNDQESMNGTDTSISNVSNNSIGRVTIIAKQSSVRVSFVQEYNSQPIIVITPRDYFAPAFIENEDTQGFTIRLVTPLPHNIEFNWFAFAKDLKQVRISNKQTRPMVFVDRPRHYDTLAKKQN